MVVFYNGMGGGVVVVIGVVELVGFVGSVVVLLDGVKFSVDFIVMFGMV